MTLLSWTSETAPIPPPSCPCTPPFVPEAAKHSKSCNSVHTAHLQRKTSIHIAQFVHGHSTFPATGSPTCRVTVHDQQMVQWRLITNSARTTHLLHRDTPWTTGLLKNTQHTCNDWQPVNKCLLMSTCVMSVPFTVNDYHCWLVKTSVTFLHVCVWGGGGGGRGLHFEDLIHLNICEHVKASERTVLHKQYLQHSWTSKDFHRVHVKK